MGTSYQIVESIINEAARRPYAGTAFTLGRQTMGVNAEQAAALFANAGVTPRAVEARLDTATLYAREHTERRSIRDMDFYAMLGFDEMKAVDISDFEGAEIITDLNLPLPATLEASCDLLVDGSTLDNIFDPVQGLKNIGRMMRPGGRCFLHNMGNASPEFGGIPYTAFNPMWFYDYFIWNDFDYCDVYTFVYTASGVAVFRLSHLAAARIHGNGLVRAIHSPHVISIMVYAEKGPASTWDRLPIQHAYRPDDQWAIYSQRASAYAEQNRAPLIRTLRADEVAPPPFGWELQTYAKAA